MGPDYTWETAAEISHRGEQPKEYQMWNLANFPKISVHNEVEESPEEFDIFESDEIIPRQD